MKTLVWDKNVSLAWDKTFSLQQKQLVWGISQYAQRVKVIEI